MLEGWERDRPVPECACQGEAGSITVRGRMRTHWDLYRRRNRAEDGGASGKSRRVEQGRVVSPGKCRCLRRNAVAGGPDESGENGILLGWPAALFTSRQEVGLRSLASCRPGTRFSRELDLWGGRTVALVRPDRPSLAAPLGAAAAFLSHGALAGVRSGSGAWRRSLLHEPMNG